MMQPAVWYGARLRMRKDQKSKEKPIEKHALIHIQHIFRKGNYGYYQHKAHQQYVLFTDSYFKPVKQYQQVNGQTPYTRFYQITDVLVMGIQLIKIGTVILLVKKFVAQQADLRACAMPYYRRSFDQVGGRAPACKPGFNVLAGLRWRKIGLQVLNVPVPERAVVKNKHYNECRYRNRACHKTEPFTPG